MPSASKDLLTPAAAQVDPAAERLRIALIYSRTPLPMRRADQMTVAHLIEFLSRRGHQLDLHAVGTGGEIAPAQQAWLEERCASVHLHEHRRRVAGIRAVLQAFRGLPLQVGYFLNTGLEKSLAADLVSHDYDLVYVYYFRSAEVVRRLLRRKSVKDALAATPRVLAMQLSQSLNAQRIRDNAPNVWTRALYTVEARLVSRYETRIWREFHKTALIGKADLAAIDAECDRQHVPRIENTFFSAHGTDISRFRPADPAEVIPNTLVFSGVMRTPTNVQAVQWFVRNAWPSIKQRIPTVRLEIVGREPTRELLALAAADPAIVVTGTVPDPAAYIARASVCINPMQAGGGMQNKLIEYLASGKPVVATSVANEGVGAPPTALRVADGATAFADAVVELLQDAATAAALGRCAREYAVEGWTWEAHFLRLEQDLLDTVHHARGTAVAGER